MTNPLHRQVISTCLSSDDPEKMQRLGMAGFNGENLPIKRLRFRQASGLVLLERECKRLGDRNRGHGRIRRFHTTPGGTAMQCRGFAIRPGWDKSKVTKSPGRRAVGVFAGESRGTLTSVSKQFPFPE
jgi:hypothetical protein